MARETLPIKHCLRRTACGAVAFLAAVGLSACDPIGPRHDTLSVELDSSTGDAVRFITSDDFIVYVNDDGVEAFGLRAADTTWVDVPYNADYDLTTTGRYFVQAAEAETPEAVVSMRVRLDGDESFYQQTTLTGEGIRYYYRTY